MDEEDNKTQELEMQFQQRYLFNHLLQQIQEHNQEPEGAEIGQQMFLAKDRIGLKNHISKTIEKMLQEQLLQDD